MDEEKEDLAPKKTRDNPIFPYRMEKRDPDAAHAYIQMIEDLVLNRAYGDDVQSCILFEIHSRAELVRALPAVAADESQTPYELKEFLGGHSPATSAAGFG
jgi:ABC-type iron transport system FetAB ATPase subunit